MNRLALDVDEVFFAALEFEDRKARSAYLDGIVGRDAAVRRRVEELLAANVLIGDFLESPLLAPTLSMEEPHAGEFGAFIGPYRLLEQIGEGGMGVVFLAEQSHPVRRKVALKVVKLGLDTKQFIARFEAERQALAMMDHPNIARVLDAGATDAGRPYFVMELVLGVPITDHCDREKLSIPERLELFVLVCRAVQHAHQKGVIHRDLKPSNVLVTVIDGVAMPKVIDFGVAKATGAAAEQTVHTGHHQFLGTPLYMSPEQADFDGVDVDTRSDVYSLGVLLYELLTGTTPFDPESLRTARLDDLRRLIREQEPTTPSARLGSLGETLSTLSANRRTDSRKLRHSVRGELDWIVMKALEKDRRRRYETANDLAADLMRYLTSRPVEACPPSTWYRFAKFARRNRVTLTAAALVTLSLLLGIAVSVWQAARATRALADARLRADETQQVVDYLIDDILGSAAPEKSKGRTITIHDILETADASIDKRFARQPLVEAAFRMKLAQAYDATARVDRCLQQTTRAAELRLRHLGPDHPDTLKAQLEVAQYLRLSDRHQEAEALGRKVLEGQRRVLGDAHPDTLYSQASLAYGIYRIAGRGDEAEDLARDAYAIAARSLEPLHPTTLTSMDVLGMVLIAQGRELPLAAQLIRQAVAGYDASLGRLHTETLWAATHLIRAYIAIGRDDEASHAARDALERFSQSYGVSAPHTFLMLARVVQLPGDEQNPAGERDLFERWLRLLTSEPVANEASLPKRALMLSILAQRIAYLPDDVPFDRELVVKAAEESVSTGAPDDSNWARLALVYLRLGELDMAEQAVRSALDQHHGGDSFDWLAQALVHAHKGETDLALQHFEHAVRTRPGYKSPFIGFESAQAEAASLLGL